MVQAVVLVPRRAGFADRDRLWKWCRAWWEREQPDLPIYEGHHDDGLFNRSAALNTAARLAGDWGVAVLIDADIIIDAARVREAIDMASKLQRVVLPFTARHNMTGQGTERIMAGSPDTWNPYIGKTYTDMCSSCVVVPRAVWDAVGGFDEGFVGWGFEDNAFAAAAETMTGRNMLYIHGELWHLSHRSAPEGKRNSPSWRANRARATLYEQAWGDREAMATLLGRLATDATDRVMLVEVAA